MDHFQRRGSSLSNRNTLQEVVEEVPEAPEAVEVALLVPGVEGEVVVHKILPDRAGVAIPLHNSPLGSRLHSQESPNLPGEWAGFGLFSGSLLFLLNTHISNDHIYARLYQYANRTFFLPSNSGAPLFVVAFPSGDPTWLLGDRISSTHWSCSHPHTGFFPQAVSIPLAARHPKRGWPEWPTPVAS